MDVGAGRDEEARFDPKGNLAAGLDGWSVMKWEYDDEQRMRSQMSFDELGRPLERKVYSEGGRMILRQVRDSDKDMGLLEKRAKAIDWGAHMLIAIHANAGGRGYLSVSGTSTYWHNPFWAPLAQAIYDRLLETGLQEFGVVGAFNYTVTRTSQLPAVLVEQAFLSNAEDEEKLADPAFRQQLAEKIYAGIVDYLKEAR